MPADKIVLGVPFYGHGKKGEYPDFINYRNIDEYDGLKMVYDEKACVPYMVNEDGEYVITFESPQSLRIKCDYINANGLGGIMFWDYSGDTDKSDLLKVLKKHIK